jgi:hypothetical protein
MFDHPLGIHKVKPVRMRCPLTTLECDETCQHIYPHNLRWLDGRRPEELGYESTDPGVREAVEKFEKEKRRNWRKLDGVADWDRDSDEEVDDEEEMMTKKKEAEAKKHRRGKGKARGTGRADAKASAQKQLALPNSTTEKDKGKAAKQKGGGEETEPEKEVKTDPSHEVRAPWFNHKRRSRWAMTHEASRLVSE